MKKENKIKKSFNILSLSLALLLLSSCAAKENEKTINVGDSFKSSSSKLTYEENNIIGTISKNNLENNYLRIVRLKYNENILEPKLMAICFYESRPKYGASTDQIDYIDLLSGVRLISIFYPKCYSEKETYEIFEGESFEIIEEINFFDYIVKENWLQEEYDINELIEFYEEKIKNELNERETESNYNLTRTLTP